MHLADELRAFELMEMARTTSQERLAIAYPHPFLLGQIDEADSRDEFFTSHRPSGPPANIADAPPFRIHPSAIVMVVKKRGDRSPYSNMVTLGRAENCDIVLRKAGISKFHAYIEIGGASQGHFALADAGSRNGTWRNDRRLNIKEPVPLASFDRLALGASVRLAFILSADFFAALRDTTL